ncbi:hypothetical protein [Chitinophaga rhizosphaerae]|uniref:hypothetical protein n=1 Tax=Chitinophaga rhizosphaerae TaxID=1864947 RepID=UPI000F7FC16E|nr:hypothetical protein [Chitinophaga rhizosphaerae]
MTQLVSKVQYKNFEVGEFVDIGERSFEETIALINSFPWKAERENIQISLTNPSITIEGKHNDFLKLSVYYQQKFILHYFDGNQTLLKKSFTRLQDAFPFIQTFFGQAPFDPAGFRKENTWLQSNLKHFVTQDFRYFLTPKSIRKYLWSKCWMSLPIFMGVFYMWVKTWSHPIDIGIWVYIFIMFFFVGGGVHLIFFFTYLKYAKGKILVMSRANDVFYYGEIDNPVKYDKKDLLECTIKIVNGSRNPYNAFAVVKLELKDGTIILIPNILVDHLEMVHKLNAHKVVYDYGLPFI